MSQVKIITDSTAYLPQDTIDKYGNLLEIVPLSVLFPGVTLVDGLDGVDQFLKLLKASPEVPTTSQPAPAAFQQVYESCLAAGQEIVVITISRKLSGTYDSAVTAAKQLDSDRISILDSGTTAAGMAMMVEEALAGSMAGNNREGIVSLLQDLIARCRIVFVPDTLEYLKKGGRIGAAAALLGSVLQIRPVLQLKDGEVSVLDKVRTRQKALQRLLNEIHPENNGRVGVIHVVAPEKSQAFKLQVQDRVPRASIRVYEAGPVISTHAGPGTLGLTFFE